MRKRIPLHRVDVSFVGRPALEDYERPCRSSCWCRDDEWCVDGFELDAVISAPEFDLVFLGDCLAPCWCGEEQADENGNDQHQCHEQEILNSACLHLDILSYSLTLLIMNVMPPMKRLSPSHPKSLGYWRFSFVAM